MLTQLRQLAKKYSTASQRQFVRFIIVGGTSFTINALILNVLIFYAGTQVVLANAAGFSVAIFNSYFLNKNWTFKDKRKVTASQFTIFIVVALVGLSLSSLLIWLFAVRLGLNHNVALVLATVIVTVWNFSANRYLVFKHDFEKIGPL